MNKCSKNVAIPPEIERFLSSCARLPSLPSVVIKIIDASKDPDISLADVADILRVDPALSAKLLRIANSPLYAKRREISNLRDALSLLGLNAALTISLSFSLVKSLNDTEEASDDSYQNFWKRSILSATIAREIGLTLKLPNLEDFFLASLLQDIGILALYCSSSECLDDTISRTPKIIDNELNKLGVDHSDIGAWLLKSWNLPEKLYTAVLCSKTPYTKRAEAYEDEIFYQCIGLSGELTSIWLDEDKDKAIEINFKSVENLLGFDKEQFNTFINDINTLLPEMSGLFDMVIIDDCQREAVINEARNILMEHNLNIIKKFDDHRQQIESLTERTKDIEEAASRDHLTGVYNRKYIEKLLNDEFENASKNHEPLSLAFIDLDDFKFVNDTYGHLAGDTVLRELAEIFNQKIRSTDKLARYGGDEFLIMLPRTDYDIAKKLLNRLIKELQASEGFNFDGNSVKISCSIGMATHLSDGNIKTLENLISAADKALYKAKKAGKNKMMN